MRILEALTQTYTGTELWMNVLPGATVEWYLDPIAWSAIATAVATIAYAVISIGLWKATKQTAILTQRMFESSNRPYITVDRLETREFAGYRRVDITFKNFGKVPGREVWVRTKVFHNEAEKHSYAPDPIFVHPGGEFLGQVNIDDPEFASILQNGGFLIGAGSEKTLPRTTP